MKTEKEGLESRILGTSRLGHHIIYASLTALFGAEAIMAGIGMQHVEEGKSLLAVVSGYSGMIAGITTVWWYNDFWAYRRRNLYKQP
jgi:membrane associated rhomboid family serine protease